MQISVIIPVYNAERFVRKAVESVLALPETGEILLIEDSSTDNSLSVCHALKEEFVAVKVLRHSSGRNMGPSASRNLGIRNACHDYVAFLDADDFYLPHRFVQAKKIFTNNHDVEGVYEATGVYYWSDEAKKNWLYSGRKELTTMSRVVASENLFELQSPIGTEGHSHLDACVLKKAVFEKVGLFDDVLRLHQDTAMLVKLAAVCKMVPGDLSSPVAMRGVHGNNRITAQRSCFEKFKVRLLLWRVLWHWGKKKLTSNRRKILLSCYLEHASYPYRNFRFTVLARLTSVVQLLILIPKDMLLLLEWDYWRRLFALFRVSRR